MWKPGGPRRKTKENERKQKTPQLKALPPQKLSLKRRPSELPVQVFNSGFLKLHRLPQDSKTFEIHMLLGYKSIGYICWEPGKCGRRNGGQRYCLQPCPLWPCPVAPTDRGVPVAALANTYYTLNSFAHTWDHSFKLKAPRLQSPSPQGLPTTQSTIWDYFRRIIVLIHVQQQEISMYGFWVEIYSSLF